MLYQIQNMFKPTPAKYKAQSETILDVFTETVQSLSAVNADIAKLSLSNAEKIAALQKDQEELLATSEKNTKIIGKLESFLND